MQPKPKKNNKALIDDLKDQLGEIRQGRMTGNADEVRQRIKKLRKG
jgi:hypothetical protein